MDIKQIREAEFQICKDINFISEEQIKELLWHAAEKLVSDIDPTDAHYVAFSNISDAKSGVATKCL